MSIDTVSPAKGSTVPPASRSDAQHASDLRDCFAPWKVCAPAISRSACIASSEGALGRICVLFNEIVAANQNMAQQLERIGKAVASRAAPASGEVGISTAAWGEMDSSVNGLIDDLVWPTTEVTRVISAVAQGDLLQTVRLDVDGRPLKGEFLRSANIVNTMIKQLSGFTSEVTRVAREVGTEGKLGDEAPRVKWPARGAS